MRKLTKSQEREYRQRLGFLIAKREKGEPLSNEEKEEYKERKRILQENETDADTAGTI